MNCLNFGNYSTLQLVSVCYPTNSTIAEAIDLGVGFFYESVSDLEHTWPVSLTVLFAGLILSLALMFLIRCCGGCLVITVIILYFAAIITFGVVCLETADNNLDIPGIDDIANPDWLRTIAYICFGIAGISFIILLCTIRKIKIGIMVIKTTAEFTQE